MALEFLDKMAKSDKPFFPITALAAVTSITTRTLYTGSSPARTSYGDCMVEMNDVFANLYKTLEKNGQLDVHADRLYLR